MKTSPRATSPASPARVQAIGRRRALLRWEAGGAGLIEWDGSELESVDAVGSRCMPEDSIGRKGPVDPSRCWDNAVPLHAPTQRRAVDPLVKV